MNLHLTLNMSQVPKFRHIFCACSHILPRAAVDPFSCTAARILALPTSLTHRVYFLVAEFISPKKCTLFRFIVGSIIPKSVKCIHSATKIFFIPPWIPNMQPSAAVLSYKRPAGCWRRTWTSPDGIRNSER